LLFSFPGFIAGIIFAVFQLLGKHPLFKHWLYIAVITLWNIVNVRWYIRPVIPTIPGAFL